MTFPYSKDCHNNVPVCIADDDDAYFVSLASSYPTNTVLILPVIYDRTTRNVLTDLQQCSETGRRLCVIALLVRV